MATPVVVTAADTANGRTCLRNVFVGREKFTVFLQVCLVVAPVTETDPVFSVTRLGGAEGKVQLVTQSVARS